MSNVTLEISIPLDEDGFIEMECDFCKGRFMLHKDVYESEDNIHFFCPICGLPSRTDTFLCPEVLEVAKQKALNYMHEEINQQLGKTIREINRSGFIQMSMKIPHKNHEKELYAPSISYEAVLMKCCEVYVKVQNMDKEIGVYCPICGGAGL